jgi:hypothetical protein
MGRHARTNGLVKRLRNRSETANYDRFLDPLRRAREPAATTTPARSARRTMFAESARVVRAVFVALIGFWYLLMYAKAIVRELGGPILGVAAVALIVALLAGLTLAAIFRMRAAAVAVTCAAFALAVPLSETVTSEKPAPPVVHAEARVILPHESNATDNLIAYIETSTWARGCVSLPPTAASGLLAAAHCSWTDARGVVTSADYFKFAGPVDAESFYEWEITVPSPMWSGTVVCGTTPVGSWAAVPTRLVIARSDESLVVIAGAATAPAPNDRDAWNPRWCSGATSQAARA